MGPATVIFRESPETVWKLGANDSVAVTDASWRAAHDAALGSALQSLGGLGGLPSGDAARGAAAWETALAQLRVIQGDLSASAESGVKPERGKARARGGRRPGQSTPCLMQTHHAPPQPQSHTCNPGYDCDGCKQARALPVHAALAPPYLAHPSAC